MKKLTALLLALCMMIAAVSALAESAVGSWYMTLADVTMGSIVLNEDGTAVFNMIGSEEMTGTWTEEENAVTVTIQNDPLTFAYDGTTLSSEQFPLPLAREEGKLAMDLLTKVMNNEEHELPEGMTEEDLTTMVMNFLGEFTNLMGSMEAPAEEAAPAAETAP